MSRETWPSSTADDRVRTKISSPAGLTDTGFRSERKSPALQPGSAFRSGRERRLAVRRRRSNVQTTPLVSPPVALAIDVSARILAQVGRADDEDLEALWPGLVASPRAG